MSENKNSAEQNSHPDSPDSLDRRDFFKIAAGGAAALVANVANLREAGAQQGGSPEEPPHEVEVLTTDRSGGDFMVDVLKSLGFEYLCANPGSSFRGLQESIINYGGNRSPEFLTCCHEESSVGMAHGYYKIEGKPLAVLAHGTVGLQHASMAIYNAYCDRVPVYVILGNTMDATTRRPGVEWAHSVQDAAAMVRDYTKWDDVPMSLPHFAESAVRAYKIAMTPPMMPVVLVADTDLQEHPIEKGTRLRIPKLTLTSPPQGDSGAVAEVARLLVAAENPVLVAGRLARTEAGMKHFRELAETLQAPVIDQVGRMNFPTRHPLNHTQGSGRLIAGADVILGLEVWDLFGTVNAFRDQLHRTSRPLTKPGAKLISITAADLHAKSNYQDFQRYTEVDLAIAADAEATLPALVEAVKRLLTADRRRAFQDRGAKLATAREQLTERIRTDASYGWDASPVSTARLSAELWAQIKDKDWSLVSEATLGYGSASGWPLKLWAFEKYYHTIGGSGGSGVGYSAPASVGAALANRKYGRLSVNLQNDGDLMYAPGVLWTAAHHRIPLLSVMHNNRAYHQETMHVQRIANRLNRGITNAHIGTTIEDPNIDYAKVAQGMGVYAEGPITDPKDLGPALKRAIAVVERGEPALLDVVTQPR
ncbi:MAG: thiamine pyrophosphate binding protein [Acidobacteria bacterium]|nr:thiamine pyrophosphate binding protein [Acidobacteriota bacterium]